MTAPTFSSLPCRDARGSSAASGGGASAASRWRPACAAGVKKGFETRRSPVSIAVLSALMGAEATSARPHPRQEAPELGCAGTRCCRQPPKVPVIAVERGFLPPFVGVVYSGWTGCSSVTWWCKWPAEVCSGGPWQPAWSESDGV